MSEEEKKGRNRRNSEEEPQEETSLGKDKVILPPVCKHTWFQPF